MTMIAVTNRLRKKSTFWKNGHETARAGNSVLMKSMRYEYAKGNKLGWKRTARLFPQPANCQKRTSARGHPTVQARHSAARRGIAGHAGTPCQEREGQKCKPR